MQSHSEMASANEHALENEESSSNFCRTMNVLRKEGYMPDVVIQVIFF